MNPQGLEKLLPPLPQLLLGAGVTIILTGVTIWLDIPVARQLLGLLTLFIIPGFLVICLFKIPCRSVSEYAVISLGLSIAFLMLFGVVLNEVLLALNIPDPLSASRVRTWLIILLLLLTGVALNFRTGLFWVHPTLETSRISWIATIIPAFFPVLSIWGAVNLNNGESNMVAAAAVFIIAGYVLFVIGFHQRVPSRTLEFSLFMIGAALLFSYSLRSWHISGWDINQEYYVYQLTQSSQRWNIADFRDPYNACLSITILPTVINAVLNINDELVFKLVYQLLFAAVPLVIYLISRNLLSLILSYLAGLSFIFQPWFIQPAPALARQEVALLFFALVVLAALNQSLPKRQKNALLTIFGAAMIVSHYSTSYIALGMLALVFIISFLRRTLPPIRTKLAGGMPQFISGRVLLVLLLFAFFWNTILTETSGNLTFVAYITALNLQNILEVDFRSEDVALALGLAEKQFDIDTVNDYIQAKNTEYASAEGLYPPEISQEFSPRVVVSPELPELIENEPLQDLLAISTVVVKQLVKALMIVGAFRLIMLALRTFQLSFEFSLLSLISIGLLFAFLVLPVISLYYNTFRVYLQTLVVSSTAVIVGADAIFYFIRNSLVRTQVIGVFLVIFFLLSYGVFAHVVGGPVTMNLNNLGEDYDKFYTHEGEVYSAQWLASAREQDTAIFADAVAALRLVSFGDGILNANPTILPSIITQESYVYLRYANIYTGITEAIYNGQQISYNYPIEFLDQHKNLIYDNGESRIFR